ncbi:MAG: hypothetical protein QXX99_00810 [Candidatus Bathyarchaeia archaeon]
MKRILLNLMLAAILGVALMLIPLSLLHMDVKGISRLKPEPPKSLPLVSESESMEISEKIAPSSIGINWLKTISTIILGAIPAAVISILIKRRLKI